MPNRDSSTTLSRVGVFTLLLLLLLAGLGSRVAQAQMCGDTFIVNGSPSDLIQYDTSANPWVPQVLGNAGEQLNALAFRPPPDNTLYAMQCNQGAVGPLVTVNLNGSVDPVGAVSGLPTGAGCYHVGAFADDGFMYVRSTGNTNAMYRIDVDASPPTATEVTFSSPVGNIADLALVDGLFYGVDSSGLVSVDPADGTVNTIGGFNGAFGAMIPASNGVFGLQNSDGAIFQFDIATGEVTQVAQAEPTANVDGARCFEAPLVFEPIDVSVTKDDGSDTYLPGEDVVYGMVVTNNGPFGVQNAEVSDPLPEGITDASWTCTDGANGGVCGEPSGSGAILDTPDLPVNATVTYELTITVPGDYSGDLENTVTVELPEGFNDENPDNNTATDTDVSEVEPGITLEKSGSGPEPLEVGATIEYSFLVTNVGNVTLTEIEVTDPLVSPVTCPQTELEPKADMTCTGSYTVTQDDVDAGSVENTATVSGAPEGGQPPVTDESTTVFPPDQAPGITLEKSGSGPDPLTVGATIEYEFLVTNTGNVTLTNVTVEDPLDGLSPIDCPDDTLAPGAEMTCTATYEVTQADVEAGVIENTATATGETPTGELPTDSSTTTFPPEEPVPALPPLAFVLLLALLATATLWTLRRARV